MNKYLMMIIMLTGLVSCNHQGEEYFRTNPEALQKAMKACPNVQPNKNLSCEQLTELANRLSRLAYQLQSNPQVFGNKILSIQQSIAKLKLEINQSGSNPQLKTELEQNEHDLADCLAVVRWFESPES